jgi:hypothetical protein
VMALAGTRTLADIRARGVLAAGERPRVPISAGGPPPRL